MSWLKSVLGWLRDLFTLISRVMRLEERVSELEKKMGGVQEPSKNLRDGLEYNKKLNYYEDKSTGECFCPNCLGLGRKIPVVCGQYMLGYGWSCQVCKTDHYQ